ncbi:MAG: DUF1552 domain-containing protein [Verrucomicrobiaceae bacterium]|nr:DUF1552 domain-containing protein [Verrucomicrobiaceae bacterium]
MNTPHITTAIPRRRFLRGLGVTLGLPLLEQNIIHAASQASPKRMLLISNNLGVLPQHFFPKDKGAGYTLSPYLKKLAAFKNDFTIFSGLSHPAVTGGHSTENCFLTAARDPTRSGFRNSISLDQFAAEKLGQQTRFPTLNLGVNIDKANRSLSWTRDGVLLPAEDSPAALFRKMFLQGDARQTAASLKRLQDRGSILDAVRDDISRFQRNLGGTDKSRLDQYLTSVRELEQRLAISGEWEQKPKPQAQTTEPKDIPDKAKFFPKIQLMLDMARLAFESDSTRIITLMVDGFATPVFEINEQQRTRDGYHNLSHHGQSKEKLAELEKVDLQQMRHLRELLTALAATPAADGSRLLDQTMVLYGSNLGDANVHNCTNLPILLAGGGLEHGQHLAFDSVQNKPLCNLFVTMLQHLGVETDVFGSATGSLGGIQGG